jgi:hypothetical protein
MPEPLRKTIHQTRRPSTMQPARSMPQRAFARRGADDLQRQKVAADAAECVVEGKKKKKKKASAARKRDGGRLGRASGGAEKKKKLD